MYTLPEHPKGLLRIAFSNLEPPLSFPGCFECLIYVETFSHKIRESITDWEGAARCDLRRF